MLVGVSGSGKSSFAARHFLPTEVHLLGLLPRPGHRRRERPVGDAGAPSTSCTTSPASASRPGKLTVVDATNVQPEARKPLVAPGQEAPRARGGHRPRRPREVCAERNAARPDRNFGAHVLRNQRSQLRRSMKGLRREGFHRVVVLNGVDEIDAADHRAPAAVERPTRRPRPVRHHRRRPRLLRRARRPARRRSATRSPPTAPAPTTPTAGGRSSSATSSTGARPRRRCCASPWAWSTAATPLCIPGNHEAKLLRALRGRNVTVSHGLAETLRPAGRRAAGVPRAGRRGSSTASSATSCSTTASWSSPTPACAKTCTAAPPVRCGPSPSTATPPARPTSSAFPCATRGPRTTGATPWSSTATRRYPKPTWLNRTICIDTGCVFGGKLTALRYPERELVSVPAARDVLGAGPAAGADAVRPMLSREPTDLDLDDVIGKRIIDDPPEPDRDDPRGERASPRSR